MTELHPVPIAAYRQPVPIDGIIHTGPSGPPGMLAIPCVDWMYTAVVAALLEMLPTLPAGSRCCLHRFNTTLAAKRNHLVKEFFRHDELEWLLFLDSDQTPPPDTLTRLLAWNVPIVGAAICARVPDYYPFVGHFAGDGDDELSWHPLPLTPETPALAAVDFCGTGCLLIRRPVLATLGEAWFQADRDGDSEDRMFFKRVKRAGFPVYADTTLRVGHLTMVSLVVPGGETPT